MANTKVSDFITKVRQLAREYEALMVEARGITGEWNALYNTMLFDTEFTGENLDIVPNPSYTQSITDAIGNLTTIISAWDAGINTNFERVT